MAPRGGFTLIELLLVVAILGIVSYYIFGSLTVSNRAYVVVDQVSESQQGMRAVAQLLERDIRHVGKMVPLGAALCADDNQGSPDVVYLSDAEAIVPDNDIAAYDGARVQGAVNNVNGAGAVTTLAVDSLLLEPAPPTRAAYDTDGDGTNDSDFQVGGGAIVIDLNDAGRGAACGTVEAVNLAAPSVTVRTVSSALGGSAGPVQLVVVPAHEYRIANTDQLQRDGYLLAEGVEDLQLAYFLDANGDNLVDPGEMHGTGSGANANFDAQGTDMGDLREVRLNLVARTRMEDRDFEGQLQATENRNAGVADGFRRRVYTSIVRPRNMARRIGI
jgi:prepilin-type N-terminal cleavage/methylation domain-containing protein